VLQLGDAKIEAQTKDTYPIPYRRDRRGRRRRVLVVVGYRRR
jgi:hypothetical protein